MLQATLDTDQRQCSVAARSAAGERTVAKSTIPVFYRECRLALAHYGLDPERELAVLERVSWCQAGPGGSFTQLSVYHTAQPA
jgi:hypothetical protein